ncbi:DUF4167 domain-containing protein [Phyllobacterium salinisoli]|uniref:DUF4167 domain-containing protein n=1 Tax=Phyllobacterium salinisoli TaxID=1899321 RepID=A0A368K233_9HYPH|nr:DUF4167 domain-containing protein [Phyllobacterium salinisoli]RCS23448.1 DUF4167 domain-containing protein [Phyllobacterium salinisoli]
MKNNNQTRQAPRAARQTAPRSPSGAARNQTSNGGAKSQGAQNQYERYIELARAEALNGNRVEAENYYQHAEHYYRCGAAEHMSPTGL